jgi:hypothetical protein
MKTFITTLFSLIGTLLLNMPSTWGQPVLVSPPGNYPNWARLSDSPTNRFEAVSITYANKIYVFQGLKENFSLNNTSDVYDPFTDTWTPLAPIPDTNGEPSGLTHYGITLVSDTVWLVGGRLNGIGNLTNKVWRYSITNNSWSEGPSLPVKWASRSVVKLGRKLYLFGGGTHLAWNTGFLCIMVTNHYMLDLDNQQLGWQKINAPLPLGMERIHGAGVVARGKLYLVGGQLGHDCGSTDVAWVLAFDPYTNQWTRVADLPLGNSHAEPGTFVVDGKIISVGGKTAAEKVMEYTPETDTWTQIETLRDENGNIFPLLGPSAKIIGNKIIVSNGSTVWDGSAPIKRTYIKNFPRTPVYELGFNPQNIDIKVGVSDLKAKESAWLWTVTGATQYQADLSNLPSWLKIKKDDGDVVDESSVEFKLSFDATGLPNGVYTHQITATANGYQSATLKISMTVGDEQPPAILAIPNQSTFEELVSLQINTQHYRAVTYKATNLPNGLSIDATSGLISGTIPEGASQNSPYQVQIEASDASNPAIKSTRNFIWTVKPTRTDVLAINARGDEVRTAGLKFLADAPTTYFTTPTWWDGEETYNQIINAAPYNDAIYKIQRTDNTNPLEMNLPIANGNYKVTLHFAELFLLNSAGSNVMNISMEGNVVLPNYDIFVEAGGLYKAVRRTVNITVTDGVFNLKITAVKGKAKINAIEIAPAIQPVNQPPVVSNAISNQNIPFNTSGNFTFAINTFNDPEDGTNLFYDAKLGNDDELPNWLTFDRTTRQFNILATPSSVGFYTIKVTAIDKGGLSISTTLTLTIPQSINDTDGDGILDNTDNCPTVSNPTQVIPTWYADLDKDGFGDPNNSQQSCTQPTDYVSNNTDNCPTVSNPTQVIPTWYADLDKDGFGDTNNSQQSCTQPTDYVSNNTDNCPTVSNPTQVIPTWYADLDKDGLGDPNNSQQSCTQPTDYVSNNTDECPTIASPNAKIQIWYLDQDNDGLGNPIISIKSCSKPNNYVSNNSDCDDNNANIKGATIWYADFDNDGFGDVNNFVFSCLPPANYVGNASDECPNLKNADGKKLTWYADLDKDGFGDANNSIKSCTKPESYVANNTDECPETATTDGKKLTWYADLDKDGFGDGNNSIKSCTKPESYVVNNTDECPETATTDGKKLTWYADLDKDGFGDANSSIKSCTKPESYVANNTDECPEVATADGKKLTWYADLDKDGFGDANSSIKSCTKPESYVANNTDECPEVATLDGKKLTWYADLDKDGFGDANNSIKSCTKPESYVANNTDECPEVATLDGKKLTWYADLDKDGFGDANNSIKSCTKPESYVANNTDECPEVTTLDGKKLTWYADLDKDGFGSGAPIFACLPPNDKKYVPNHSDCDDSDALVYPNAPKTNDGRDNNCNDLRGEVQKLVVYPSPTYNGIFYLDYPKSPHQQLYLQIIDLNGKVVYQNEVTLIKGQLSSYSINVRNIAIGLYILQIQSPSKTEVIKVMKAD